MVDLRDIKRALGLEILEERSPTPKKERKMQVLSQQVDPYNIRCTLNKAGLQS